MYAGILISKRKGPRPPMTYSWKYSVALLALLLVAFLVLLNWQSWALANASGRVIAAVLDLRFLIIFTVALIFSGRINPLILALMVGAIQSAYFQVKLQDHWDRLGIPSPSAFDTFWPAFVAALVLLSVGHAIMGMVSAWRQHAECPNQARGEISDPDGSGAGRPGPSPGEAGGSGSGHNAC